MKQLIKKALIAALLAVLVLAVCAFSESPVEIPVTFTWNDGDSVVDTDAYRRDITYVFYRAEIDDVTLAAAFDGNTLTLAKNDFAGQDIWSDSFFADEGYFYFLHAIVDENGDALSIPSYEIENIGLETTTASLIANEALSYDYDFKLRVVDDLDPLTENYNAMINSLYPHDLNVHTYKKVIQLNERFDVICDHVYFVPFRMDGDDIVYLEDSENGITVPGLPEGKTYTACCVTLLDDATDLDLLDDAGFSGFSEPSCLIASYINNNYSPVDLVSFELPSMPKVSPSGNEYADGMAMVITYPNGKVTRKVISANVTDSSDVFYKYMDYVTDEEAQWAFEAELLDAVETNNNGVFEFRMGIDYASWGGSHSVYLQWEDENNKDRTRPDGWEEVPLKEVFVRDNPEMSFDFDNHAVFARYKVPTECLDKLIAVEGTYTIFDPMEIKFLPCYNAEDYLGPEYSGIYYYEFNLEGIGLLEHDHDELFGQGESFGDMYFVPALVDPLVRHPGFQGADIDAFNAARGEAFVRAVGFDVDVPEGYTRIEDQAYHYKSIETSLEIYAGTLGTLYCEVTDETRKAHDLSVTVNYDDIAEIASMSRPELELTLEYYDPIASEWKALTDSTMADFVKVTEENPSAPTQTVTFANGDTSATVTWNSMVENWWETDAIGTQIEYRAVLNVVSNLSGYTFDVGQNNEVEISEEDFTGEFTCTYEIPGTKPTIKKLWTNESGVGYTLDEIGNMINSGLIPETVKMQLYYRTSGATVWNVFGQVQELSVLAIAENPAQWYTALPQKDNLGNSLEYMFREVSAKYKSAATYVDIAKNYDGVYSDGTRAVYTPSAPFTSANTNVTASNILAANARKANDISVTITIDDIEEFAFLTRPELELTLEYYDPIENKWVALTDDTIDDFVLDTVETPSEAAQTPEFSEGETSVTITWTGMVENWWDTDAAGTPIEYRIVLGDISDDTEYTFEGVGADNVIEINAELTCTLELPETKPTIKKLWVNESGNEFTLAEIANMINDGEIPEYVKMQLYYRATGTEAWSEFGQAQELSTLAIAENAAEWYTVLPEKDNAGNTLEFMFVEKAVKYKSAEAYVDVVTTPDGIYSDGTSIEYKPTAAFNSSNMNATASNVLPLSKGTVTLVHTWQDNDDENDARSENLYYTLMYRVDGTEAWNPVTKGTLDAYGRYTTEGVHTTSDVTQALPEAVNNEASLVWENLPTKSGNDLLYYKAVLTDESGETVTEVDSYNFTTDTTNGVVPNGETQTFIFTYDDEGGGEGGGEDEPPTPPIDPPVDPGHPCVPCLYNPIGCLVGHILYETSRIVRAVNRTVAFFLW